jgi:hypothetical protein
VRDDGKDGRFLIGAVVAGIYLWPGLEARDAGARMLPFTRVAFSRGLFVRSLLGEPLRSQPRRLVARGLSARFIISSGALCLRSGRRRFLETGFGPFSMLFF